MRITMKTKICDRNCYAIVTQENDHVSIEIGSDDEYKGEAIALPTVSPDALQYRPKLKKIGNALVKGYSENTGMPDILTNEGIIGAMVASHRSGFVTIGEYEVICLKEEEA